MNSNAMSSAIIFLYLIEKTMIKIWNTNNSNNGIKMIEILIEWDRHLVYQKNIQAESNQSHELFNYQKNNDDECDRYSCSG